MKSKALPSILIVGCGSIGERHLRCFQKTGRAQVTACDTNPQLLERMRQTYGVSGTLDWEKTLAEGGHTAVVICTPAPAHVSMAMAAMQRGAHVLVEKPLSHSLQDVDALVAKRDQSRRQAAVAYVYHFFPVLAAARDRLLAGDIGPVLHATVTSGQPFHRLRPAYAQTYYRERASGGGAIQDALTHMANWMESVVGPTDSVLCDCAHQALAGVEVEDTVHVSARHGATLVNYTLNQFQAPNETTFQFNAASASLKVELHAHRWGLFHEGNQDWTWHNIPVPDRDMYFISQANAFLDQIEGRSPAHCSLEAAAQTLRFNLAALASADSGQRVSCASLHG
jgi:predicted dehydrogenase